MNTLLGFPEGGSALPFGRVLRQWRDARHLSQLALATEAGISTRHLSFLETGRAQPSRAIAFLNEIYPPGADTGDEMLTHEGEETGILVEGRLELVVGLETFVLEAGDSYYFESTKPHRFRNPFDAPARLISAATPANF